MDKKTLKEIEDSLGMDKKTKQIMKTVWDDIFNNEHLTCRNFEDYWQWKVGEQDYIQCNRHKIF